MLEMADVPPLSAFLHRCFAVADTARFASPDMLAWKYRIPSGDATSYVVTRDGRIVAHAGVLRATLRWPTGESLEAATVIDWAADPEAPGAGLALYRHAMRQAQAMYLVGGTNVTRLVADRLGFRRAMEGRVFTRWVRPVQEFLHRPRTSSSWLRLAHGIVRAPLRRLASRRGLSIARVHRFDDAVSSVLASCAFRHGVVRHTAANLNHRLSCPGRSMRGHVIVRRGVVAGVAVSSLGDWDAKILFVQVDSTDVSDWSAAYSLVTSALAREQRVCRVSALTSVPMVELALTENHFWKGGTEPVLVYDPSGAAAGLRSFDLSYVDTDFDYYNA